MINFSIEGPGEIIGLDNGDEVCHESFKGNSHSAFNGKCLCIVKSKRGEKGVVKIKAQAEGLKDGTVSFNTK
jgi:beta-galactosidase